MVNRYPYRSVLTNNFFCLSTVRTFLKLYFNINQLANQPDNYNLLILINSHKKTVRIIVFASIN